MIELIGALLGGALRLTPELLKWFERKDEHKHELLMLNAQLAADKQRADLGLRQTEAEGAIKVTLADIQALTDGAKAQGQMTGIRWVDALNQAQRPILVYWWCVGLYTAVLVARLVLLLRSDIGAAEALTALWGDQEKAITSSMFAFLFLDRTLRHKAKGTG